MESSCREYWREWLLLLLKEQFRRLQMIFADSAYKRNGLVEIVKQAFGWIPQPVLRPVGVNDFVVLPKR